MIIDCLIAAVGMASLVFMPFLLKVSWKNLKELWEMI
jgi:hypothetical protein